MAEIYEIPQRTRMLAILSPNAAMFGWLLGGLPSCLGIFMPPVLFCSLPLFVVLTAVGGFAGYIARQQIAESGGQYILNRAATVGMVIGIAGAVIGLLATCVFIIASVTIGPALINEMFSGMLLDSLAL